MTVLTFSRLTHSPYLIENNPFSGIVAEIKLLRIVFAPTFLRLHIIIIVSFELVSALLHSRCTFVAILRHATAKRRPLFLSLNWTID